MADVVHNQFMDTVLDLDKLKKARGLRSTSDVAKELGITRQQVYNYENGISEPPLSVVLKLVNIYGIKLKDIISDKNLSFV